jgi:hypothetical protein
MIKKTNSKNRGYLLIQVLIFSTIAVYILVALINWTITDLKSSRREIEKESAFQIAEAGIDYYRWHLSQAQTDYKDGTNHSGPYVHDFSDINKNIIGNFTLDIIPPPPDSNIVTIESTGKVNSNQNIEKTIVAKFDLVSNKYITLSWEEIK